MSSPVSSIFPAFPLLPAWSSPKVSSEQMKAFHQIDRTLFSRLVFTLNRDISQSFQVLGFLLLLERKKYAGGFIALLMNLPDTNIESVANEIGLLLHFLYDKDFFSSMSLGPNHNYDTSVIPWTVYLTEGRLGLREINEKRETLLAVLNEILNDTCTRVFEDLIKRAERRNRDRILALEREKGMEILRKIRSSVQQGTSSRVSVPQVATRKPFVHQVWVPTIPRVEEDSNREEATLDKTAEEEEIPADDRTVFLTFSKGYPITEEQVMVYFTQKFGEVIEAIVFQDVEGDEQPLYARMVLKMRYVSNMDDIVCGSGRNRFTIDGKHFWAPKFVCKSLASASESASSSQT